MKTWTVLEETANIGDDFLKLRAPVDWSVNDSIAIASTGGHMSQSENEKMQIKSISPDGLTVYLTEKLKHKHLGITQSFSGGVTLETRAEVGLLTHNVVVRGYNDPQWNDKIPACPDGFDPGEK